MAESLKMLRNKAEDRFLNDSSYDGRSVMLENAVNIGRLKTVDTVIDSLRDKTGPERIKILKNEIEKTFGLNATDLFTVPIPKKIIKVPDDQVELLFMLSAFLYLHGYRAMSIYKGSLSKNWLVTTFPDLEVATVRRIFQHFTQVAKEIHVASEVASVRYMLLQPPKGSQLEIQINEIRKFFGGMPITDIVLTGKKRKNGLGLTLHPFESKNNFKISEVESFIFVLHSILCRKVNSVSLSRQISQKYSTFISPQFIRNAKHNLLTPAAKKYLAENFQQTK